MTEDEAKTKWCPKVQLMATGDPVNGGDILTNRGDRPAPGMFSCIGSECMVWRKSEDGYYADDDAYIEGQGHCGLAGKP
jgi:hypothetical protein